MTARERLDAALEHLDAAVDGDATAISRAYAQVLLARDELRAPALHDNEQPAR